MKIILANPRAIVLSFFLFALALSGAFARDPAEEGENNDNVDAIDTTSAPLAQAAPAFALDADATRPLVLRFGHEILISPKRKFEILRSDWRLDALELRLFGGGASVTGRGRAGKGRDTEVDATITLRRVDAERLLEFTGFSRHDEVQARLSGRIAIAARGRQWERIAVNLAGEPGSLAISRALLRDLLGQLGGKGLTPETIDKTLTRFFGSRAMIPLDALAVEGGLDGPKLRLRVPLHNAALNVDIEPLIDLGLLWDLWGYIRDSGLARLNAIRRIE